MDTKNKIQFLKGQIYVSKIDRCDTCSLAMGNSFVPCRSEGLGHTMFFINECPSQSESVRKQAFVNKANMFLKNIIQSNGLLEDSFFTQLVRCKPFLNSTPYPKEIDKCQPYLIAELRHHKPLIIVTVGLSAYNAVVGDKCEFISSVVNKPILIDRHISPFSTTHLPGNKAVIIPIHQPSYIIKSGKIEEYDKSFEIINDFYRTLINKFH